MSTGHDTKLYEFCSELLSFVCGLKSRLALTHVQPPNQVNQYLGLRRNNHSTCYASYFNFNSETNVRRS
jgi:hypothetical protein